jgi:circadian clock protein KaiB
MSATASTTIEVRVRIFVAGDSPTSRQALRNWRSMESMPEMEGVGLEVINVLVDPQQALDNRVLATPTLIIAGPSRRLRYMGTLDDSKHVLELIGHCRGDQESV